MSKKSKANEMDEQLLDAIHNNYTTLDIIEEMQKDFVLYANETNKNRAFAWLPSGMKPIGLHATWGMYYNKRYFNKPYTKSAKVEGEIMAFSPHGGSYGSLVRLAQDFVYHVPYIDGHGSFGSVIGGPTPGASRYTEMRLSEFTHDVLLYNTDILDMGLNYLDEDPEPIFNTWQALLPTLFMTNTEGMGYTISNKWSSGNLLEFKEQLHSYLKTKKVDCSKIYPDFPTGGIIINKSDMKSLYETGKGTIILRGKTEIDGDTIKILSLPYQIFPEIFIEDVKKYVTTSNNTIKDVANRCGKTGFLIEIECEPGTAEYTLEVLFRKTSLQVKIADEHKCITPEGKPVLVSFAEYMKYFVDGNIEVVKKEAKYNLDKIEARLELVNGLLNALDIIDKIIATIKKSKSMDDAKQAIMQMPKYKFTERQADYIVHTPLGRLANLEQIKLQDEKKELDKQKEINQDLFDNYKSQEKYFIKRFDKLVDKYGWERKTEVVDIEMQDLRVAVEKPKTLKPKKEFMVIFSNEGNIKRVEVSRYRAAVDEKVAFKVVGNQDITIITNKGKMYKILSNTIDLCLPAAAGQNIKDLRPEIEKDEKVLMIYSPDTSEPYMYFVTKFGLGKTLDTKQAINLSKRVGATVCGLKLDGDEVIFVSTITEGQNIEITTNMKTEVITPDGPQGRGGSGKRIISLRKKEEITGVKVV